jgi:hypothetical protein
MSRTGCYSQKNGKLDPAVQSSSRMSKSQEAFLTPVDNSDSPWVPNVRHKFHAMVPLGYVYHDEGEDISDEIIMFVFLGYPLVLAYRNS